MATVPGMVEKVRDGYNEEFMKKKLKEQLSADQVEVLDTSEFGGGGVFAAIVVSSMFIGKSLIDRHNIVSNALAEELKTLNGFTQKCFTPEQWKGFWYKDPTCETKAQFAKETVEQISKLVFTSEKTKFSSDTLTMTAAMMRIFVMEAAHRAAGQAKSEGSG